MSNESAVKSPPMKNLPAQIQRLKKEEDEELWISGEELYTDGSSDEENCRCKSSSKESSSTITKLNRPKIKGDKKLTSARTKVESIDDKDKSDDYSESTGKSIVTGDEDDYAGDDNEISWKVNREQIDCQYKMVCDSLDTFLKTFKENVEENRLIKQTELLTDEIKSSIVFLDNAASKLNKNLKCVKEKINQIKSNLKKLEPKISRV